MIGTQRKTQIKTCYFTLKLVKTVYAKIDIKSHLMEEIKICGERACREVGKIVPRHAKRAFER